MRPASDVGSATIPTAMTWWELKCVDTYSAADAQTEKPDVTKTAICEYIASIVTVDQTVEFHHIHSLIVNLITILISSIFNYRYPEPAGHLPIRGDLSCSISSVYISQSYDRAQNGRKLLNEKIYETA